jgi:hypothetical protein
VRTPQGQGDHPADVVPHINTDTTTLFLMVVAALITVKFIGFIGNRMYELLVMIMEDVSPSSSGILIVTIGSLGWLVTIGGGVWLYTQFHHH